MHVLVICRAGLVHLYEYHTVTVISPVAKFLVPDWGIKSTVAYTNVVPGRQLASQYDYSRVDYIPQSGTKNLASVPAVYTNADPDPDSREPDKCGLKPGFLL